MVSTALKTFAEIDLFHTVLICCQEHSSRDNAICTRLLEGLFQGRRHLGLGAVKKDQSSTVEREVT